MIRMRFEQRSYSKPSMNPKKILPFLLISFSLYVFSSWMHQWQNTKTTPAKTPGYQSLWKRVDSCEKKGLTNDALKTVELIYNKAKAENNAPQFVKAVLHKMKFTQYKEEFSQEKTIEYLEKEVQSAQFPIRPILHSILADAYWQYYQNNRWKFQDRSTTVNFDKKDISTYSLKDLVNAAILNHKSALGFAKQSKEVKLEVFDEILIKGNAPTRSWRPTLYDFLAHRALDFFKNSEADVMMAAHQFSLNDETYLKPYPDFLTYSIPKAADSLDFRYYAISLYQQVEQFKLNSKNTEGLLDVELDRLQFARSNSNHPNKEAIYLESINWLSREFKNSPRISEILFLKADWEISRTTETEEITDSLNKWRRKKAFEICREIISAYPKSRGANQAQNLMNQIRSKTLEVKIERVNSPDVPNRMFIRYTNVPKLYFRIVKTTLFEYQLLSGRHYGNNILPKLLKLQTVKEIEQELPDDHDFNTHSTEVQLPALPFGYYVVLASTSKSFVQNNQVNAYQLCVVSDLAYLHQKNKLGNNDFYVLHRESGKALAGVSAQVWTWGYNNKTKKGEYQKGESFVSDEKGFFRIPLQGQNNRNYFIEFRNGEDVLFSEDNFYHHYQEEYEQTITSSFIFTDRAIYRPGQTVYFKSILLSGRKNNFSPLAAKEVLVTFYDVNSQKISSQNLVTNEYGTVSGSFTAPMGVLNGQMRLSDGISSRYISVEEYKRPKFETAFDTLKGEYQLYDTVRIKGYAKAYAGNAIDGAKVNYRVVRRVNYPIWWYWYRPHARASQAVEIANGSTTSNEKGEYSFRFHALPDETTPKKDDPTFHFEIFAEVTDINGETHSTSSLFVAGYKSLLLDIDVPETINLQNPPKLILAASNLNGVEQNTKATLRIYKLIGPEKIFRKRLWGPVDKPIYKKEEYYKLFPHDQYADELNQYTWPKGQKVLEKTIETENSGKEDWKELNKLEPGVYLAEGTCKDKNGAEVKTIKYFTAYDPQSSTLPFNTGQWDYLSKNKFEPGEKAELILASGYKEVNCYFEEANSEGSTLKTIQPSLNPISIPVTENHRGGFTLNSRFVKHGRIYNSSHYVSVPFTNKELDITYSTFRNKLLPGQKEEWTLRIKNKKGEKVAAELLASMYDASLDAFVHHNWDFSIYTSFYSRHQWSHSLEDLSQAMVLNNIRYDYLYTGEYVYDYLNYFGMNFYGGRYDYIQIASSDRTGRKNKRTQRKSEGVEYEMYDESGEAYTGAAPAALAEMKSETAAKNTNQLDAPSSTVPSNASPAVSPPRKNFNETAFFFPQLQTNEQGEVLLKFTLPESLTRWRLMSFAHSKDLSYGFSENFCVTQKDLMVVPNLPRFFREGDSVVLKCKLNNLSGQSFSCNSELQIFDAVSDKDITKEWANINLVKKETVVQAKQSEVLNWRLKVPENAQAVKIRFSAGAGQFSDAEENVVPVLSNRMLVTESMPLPVRGKTEKKFTFTKFQSQNNNSPTLKNHAYTLEFTANPAWYAVQSLPYLMEYPYECAEQTFARYYANALASHIANSKPKIKAIFDAWKNASPESFLSNLEKNQELKSLIVQETPWLLNAQTDSENKKRLALLFDLNNMSHELRGALSKLQNMQSAGGGWPWFKGCPDDWYITQHILMGFGKLKKLGVLNAENEQQIANMKERALRFCDEKLLKHYQDMKRYNKNYASENHLDHMGLQYLFMRSHFPEQALPAKNKEAFDFYIKQAKTHWLSTGRYMQGMIALTLNRYKEGAAARDIMKSLKQNALESEEMGMYWKENYGYYWYQAPIEMQAMMIEAFDEILNDMVSVDALKTWLIKSKQTQHWKTTRATTEAVYALLLRGADWLATEPNVEIQLGDLKLDPKNDPEIKSEAGTGYFKKTFHDSEIKPAMANISVKKKDEGVSWGAVYWQYFEQLDKITPHETPLQLSKKLFLQQNSNSGPVMVPITHGTALKIGDKITVRIELRVDRDMEYVHLKDMRASGFEPLNVLSTYKYQDGLGYYESTGDAATHFFISWLAKGTYVFEYPVVVSHSGNFSNGISSIQCMYAPEFTSHSEGQRVLIGD